MDRDSESGSKIKAVAGQPTRSWRAWVFQGYVVAAVIGFTVLLILVSAIPSLPFDITITRAIQRLNVPGAAGLMAWVSYLGFAPQAYWLTGAIVLLLFALGLRWEAVTALIASPGGTTVGVLFKFVVHRPRPTPDIVNVVEQLSSYSFPSGHVLFYTAFFGYLFFLTFTLLRRSWLRVVLLILLGALIALVGPSRMYLGQHWFSDVLGGYLLGGLWLLVTVRIYRWGKPRFFVHQPVAPAAETESAPAASGSRG